MMPSSSVSKRQKASLNSLVSRVGWSLDIIMSTSSMNSIFSDLPNGSGLENDDGLLLDITIVFDFYLDAFDPNVGR